MIFQLASKSSIKKQTPNQGMSLLEVLIGVTILSFAMGPLFLLFSHAGKSLKNDGKSIQALFLTEKVLAEVKAGVRRNPQFLCNVPLGSLFQIVNKKSMSIYKGNVPEFLQNIHGYGKTIDSDSPLYEQFKNYWIDIQSEYAGKKQYIIRVNTIWKEGKKTRNVKLFGLIETIPNEFNENTQ